MAAAFASWLISQLAANGYGMWRKKLIASGSAVSAAGVAPAKRRYRNLAAASWRRQRLMAASKPHGSGAGWRRQQRRHLANRRSTKLAAS